MAVSDLHLLICIYYSIALYLVFFDSSLDRAPRSPSSPLDAIPTRRASLPIISMQGPFVSASIAAGMTSSQAKLPERESLFVHSQFPESQLTYPGQPHT